MGILKSFLCKYFLCRFFGHSFRRRGACFALHSGVPSDYIKLQGDWKSNAYERYLDHSLRYKIVTVKHVKVSLTNFPILSLRAVVWAIKTHRTPKRVAVYLVSDKPVY